MDHRAELEGIVHRSLSAFVHHVRDTGWWGKEREAVNYYAFGFLLKECRRGSVLFDPAQLVIESRVKQINKPKSKNEVCKDLVIWAKPGQGCWDKDRKSVQYPLVIMEWKANTDRIFAYDRDWLLEFSKDKPDFTGICLSMNMLAETPTLTASRIADGEETADGLVIG